MLEFWRLRDDVRGIVERLLAKSRGALGADLVHVFVVVVCRQNVLTGSLRDNEVAHKLCVHACNIVCEFLGVFELHKHEVLDLFCRLAKLFVDSILLERNIGCLFHEITLLLLEVFQVRCAHCFRVSACMLQQRLTEVARCNVGCVVSSWNDHINASSFGCVDLGSHIRQQSLDVFNAHACFNHRLCKLGAVHIDVLNARLISLHLNQVVECIRAALA